MAESNDHPSTKSVLFENRPIGKIQTTGDDRRDLEAAEALLKGKGLIPDKVDQIDAIHNKANAFATVAIDLYERDLARIPRVGASMYPFVVNAAFSIELYLKTLHRRFGKSARGHQVRKLFDALPAEAQQVVFASGESVKHKHALGEEPQILNYLDQLNEAFEKWRYSYEHQYLSQIGIPSTIFLIDALHQACCRVRPAATQSEKA